MNIKGIVNYVDENNKKHETAGICTLKDDIKLKSIDVKGMLSFDKIICDKINIEGDCTGNEISGKKIFISGKFNVDNVSMEQNIKIVGVAHSNLLKAEKVIIESRAGTIKQINCDKIKIFDNNDNIDISIIKNIFNIRHVKNNARIHINDIDANNVEIQNCEIKSIKCKNAIIGTNCLIEELFVEDSYKIANDSTVNKIVRR